MMPGLLKLCKKLFKTTDLYEVLSISKKATANEGNCTISINRCMGSFIVIDNGNNVDSTFFGGRGEVISFSRFR